MHRVFHLHLGVEGDSERGVGEVTYEIGQVSESIQTD